MEAMIRTEKVGDEVVKLTWIRMNQWKRTIGMMYGQVILLTKHLSSLKLGLMNLQIRWAPGHESSGQTGKFSW